MLAKGGQDPKIAQWKLWSFQGQIYHSIRTEEARIEALAIATPNSPFALKNAKLKNILQTLAALPPANHQETWSGGWDLHHQWAIRRKVKITQTHLRWCQGRQGPGLSAPWWGWRETTLDPSLTPVAPEESAWGSVRTPTFQLEGSRTPLTIIKDP